MAEIIPIDSVPNQNFSIVLDNNRYDISLKSSKTSTFATVTRDEVVLIQNVRCLGGTPLIPYRYLQADAGNFAFDTPNEQIPYYTNFGDTQFLVYLHATELEAIGA